MNRAIAYVLVLASLAGLLLVACAAPAAAPAPPEDGEAASPSEPEDGTGADAQTPDASGCVDFSGYADNHVLGQSFIVDSLQFTALGANDVFVNYTDNIMGLQFEPDGIQIDLPSSSSTVSLLVGSWTPQQLDIQALDADGNVVDQSTVPGDNNPHSVTLSGQDISTVIITGGGFEGILVEICFGGASLTTDTRTSDADDEDTPAEDEDTPADDEDTPADDEDTPADMGSGACLDFSAYADNHVLGQSFTIDGLHFTALGADDVFVNYTDDIMGLQFQPEGIQIDLPTPAASVSITAGSWTPQALDIQALDSGGTVLDQLTIPGANDPHDVVLHGEEIATVIISGGGYEGILVQICFGDGS